MNKMLNIFYMGYGKEIREEAEKTNQNFIDLFLAGFYKFMNMANDEMKEYATAEALKMFS